MKALVQASERRWGVTVCDPEKMRMVFRLGEQLARVIMTGMSPSIPIKLLSLSFALLVWSSSVISRPLIEIKATGELRICVAGSSAAFYQGNAESFARSLGVTPVVTVLKSWDQQFHNLVGATEKEITYEAALLANGECDLFPNDLHMLDWRRTKMQLIPYYTTRKMVIAHRSLAAHLTQLSDLAGKKAAVQNGTAYEAWLVEQNETGFKDSPITIELYPTSESMQRVADQRADFTIIGAESAFKWVRGNLESLDLLFPVDAPVQVGWGISSAAGDLHDAVVAYFVANKRVGSDLDRAWQRQYGISLMEYQLYESSFDSQGTQFKELSRWALPVGSALFGVVLAMLFWTRRLKRLVKQHERTEAQLRKSQQIVQRETARRAAIADISIELQQADGIEAIGRILCSSLANQIPLGHALFMVHDPLTGNMRAVGQWAGGGVTPVESLQKMPFVSGLIQRCMAAKESVVLVAPESEHLKMRTGLGNFSPAGLLLYPVRKFGHVLGILELATLQAVTADDQKLLADLEPFIVLSLETHLLNIGNPDEVR